MTYKPVSTRQFIRLHLVKLIKKDFAICQIVSANELDLSNIVVIVNDCIGEFEASAGFKPGTVKFSMAQKKLEEATTYYLRFRR